MRVILALGLFLAGAAPALAQDALAGSVNSGLSSQLGGNLEGRLSGGVGSGLGGGAQRTLADPFNPDPVGGGGGCANGQADPDHTGCRPAEWLRRERRQSQPRRDLSRRQRVPCFVRPGSEPDPEL